MPKNSSETRVLIAGGGPVGVTLAMDLASRGISSIILEKRRDIPASPRCNTINARSMEIFRRLGVADAVRACGLPAEHNTDVVYMTRFNGEELTRYERPTTADWAAGTPVGLGADWPAPEPQHFVSQLYVEPVLRDHAAKRFGVAVRAGWELVSFEQDDEGVTALARDVESGAEERIRADYLIGADGGASVVRSAIGARLEGNAEVGRRITTFFRAPALKALYERAPGWMYRFVGGCNLIAIDGADLWLTHNRVPPDADLQTWDIWPDIFDAIGQRFDYEVINQVRWTPRAMVANKMREGRVILAGDAAHIWVPMGGFGMNAGVADATALGWMLAGVIDGWLAPDILDAFEAERAPMGERVAGQAAQWIRDLVPLTGGSADDAVYQDAGTLRALGDQIRDVNIGEFDCPGMQLGYYYENSPIIVSDPAPPPPFMLDRYVETSWPGVRAPHFWLADGRSVHDAMGDGFTLLRIGKNPPAGAALIAQAQARGIPFTVLDLDQPEAIAKYEGYGLVLVRPDRHVAWRSNVDVDDPAAILDRITGRLIPPRTVAQGTARRIGDGFGLGEGLRWRGQSLVLSDMTGRTILDFDPATGRARPLGTLSGMPNGLAILPDGRLIAATMGDAKLHVIGDGAPTPYADISALVTGYAGDMACDAAGRIYVCDTGARILEETQPIAGRIILVEPDGTSRIVLEGLAVPNGIVVTADGQNLLVAETRGGRISQCRIDKDGGLSGYRPFVPISGSGIDGLALDAMGILWACRLDGGVDGYDPAGRLVAQVATPDGIPISCAATGDRLYIAGVARPTDGTLLEAIAKGAVSGWMAEIALPIP